MKAKSAGLLRTIGVLSMTFAGKVMRVMDSEDSSNGGNKGEYIDMQSEIVLNC